MVGSKSLVGSLVLLVFQVGHTQGFSDYWNIFCGKGKECYEILGLTREASLQDVKRTYRQESLRWHPDKNKAPDAPQRFQDIAKAYEVLSNAEKRKSYDYYTDHPNEYWSAYGQYFYTTYAPQTDVRLVLVALVVVVSILQTVVQYQKYQRVCRYLTRAAVKGWGLHEGGSKETLEIRRRALEACAQTQALNGKKSGGKPVSKKGGKSSKKGSNKDEDDPELVKAVEQVVASMEIKGGYRKPELEDLIAYQLVLLPYILVKGAVFNARWFYTHTIQGIPYSEEEEEYLARRRVSPAAWDELPFEEQTKLIKMRVWEGQNYESYLRDKEIELLRKRPGQQWKQALRYRKKHVADKYTEEVEEVVT